MRGFEKMGPTLIYECKIISGVNIVQDFPLNSV